MTWKIFLLSGFKYGLAQYKQVEAWGNMGSLKSISSFYSKCSLSSGGLSNQKNIDISTHSTHSFRTKFQISAYQNWWSIYISKLQNLKNSPTTRTRKVSSYMGKWKIIPTQIQESTQTNRTPRRGSKELLFWIKSYIYLATL